MANGDLAVVEALRLLSQKTLISFTNFTEESNGDRVEVSKNGGFREAPQCIANNAIWSGIQNCASAIGKPVAPAADHTVFFL